MRFHHRLVFIHPFSNGNGRHARLIADVLVKKQGRPVFSWGAENRAGIAALRKRYIEALQAADRVDIRPLLAFARS